MARLSGPALSLLLVLTVALFSQDAAAQGCCRKYSRAELPFRLIRGYSIQSVRTVCNIDAIIFHTSFGRNVCADPSQNWVMENIRKLKEKVQAMKQTKPQ